MSYRSVPSTEPPKENGVQALIERLKKQGVEAGQQQANAMLEEAHAKARKTLAEAQQEAERIRQQARDEAAREKIMGQEALRLASRDVMVSLKNQIIGLVAEVFGRQVTEHFNQEAFLKELLLTVCQQELQHVAPGQPVKVLFSEDWAKLSTTEDGAFKNFVNSLCQEGLSQGVEFGTTSGKYAGFKVQVESEQVIVDLTDQSVAALLKQYLLPRFRAVLEGYV
jgi:V/A-type H+-transporting ATPase subunit E